VAIGTDTLDAEPHSYDLSVDVPNVSEAGSHPMWLASVSSLDEAVAWVRSPSLARKTLAEIKRGHFLVARYDSELKNEQGSSIRRVAVFGKVLAAARGASPPKVVTCTKDGIFLRDGIFLVEGKGDYPFSSPLLKLPLVVPDEYRSGYDFSQAWHFGNQWERAWRECHSNEIYWIARGVDVRVAMYTACRVVRLAIGCIDSPHFSATINNVLDIGERWLHGDAINDELRIAALSANDLQVSGQRELNRMSHAELNSDFGKFVRSTIWLAEAATRAVTPSGYDASHYRVSIGRSIEAMYAQGKSMAQASELSSVIRSIIKLPEVVFQVAVKVDHERRLKP